MSFSAPNKSLFFSKNDPKDLRFGDLVQKSPFENSQFHLIGYPDDEGISLNGGRVGAAEAPDTIRKWFYKMTPPILDHPRLSLLDHGNLEVSKVSLGERHELGRKKVSKLLSQEKKLVTYGGGHDYGFPDGAGFLDLFKNQDGVVINFDAHLDVRNTDRGLSSGTPFFRLFEEFDKFPFYEIGIEPHCNSINHLNWLNEKGGVVFDGPKIREKKMEGVIDEVISSHAHQTPCFISVDIDGFHINEAPGCSQAWASGFHFEEFLNAFSKLVHHFYIPLLGIYEVSPPLDRDDQTSKLAALIHYHFIKESLQL